MAKDKYQERIEARSNQDAANYTRLCDDLGIEPEDIPLYERGQVDRRVGREFREGQLVKMADAWGEQGTPKKDPNPRKKGFDYTHLKIELARGDYRPDDVFHATDDKRRVLKESGLARAYVGPGQTIPLDDASDARVGKIFQDYAKRARKKD